jgi:hypothetical protein
MAKRRKTHNTMAKRRKTHNTMAKRKKKTTGQSTICKTLHSIVVCEYKKK